MKSEDIRQASLPELLARYWLVLAITLSLMLLASWVLTARMARYEPTPLYGLPSAIGLVLTGWGVLISVGGFAVTWFQLYRTQTSAEAVAKALLRLKRDYNSFDLIAELRAARTHGKAAMHSSQYGRWVDALAGFHGIRESLNRISSVKTILSEEQVSVVKERQMSVLDACHTLATNVDPSSIEDITSRTINLLMDLDEVLTAIEMALKEEIGEKN